MKRFALILAAPFLLAFTTPTVVTWSAPAVSAPSRAPGQAIIRVKGDIVNKWHVYSLTQKPGGPKALSFELESANGFSIGSVAGPTPQTAFDAEFKMETETYSGSPVFLVPVKWAKPLPAGTTELRLIVRYMACSDKLCLPPRKEALAVRVLPPSAR